MNTTSPELLSEVAWALRQIELGSSAAPVGLAMAMVLEQLPNPDGWVTLSEKVDVLGRP